VVICCISIPEVPRGRRFSSLNLAARRVVKCCRIYT
jgi:hypothetical protein